MNLCDILSLYRFRIILPTFFVCMLCGCSGLNVNYMVPEITQVHIPPINKSVRVGKVSRGSGPFQDNYPLNPDITNNDTIRSAILQTLLKANVFREVKKDGDADLELTATILESRYLPIDRLPLSSLWGQRVGTTIHYTIVDKHTGMTVWNDILQSEFGFDGFDSFYNRLKRANEGCVRTNMELLLGSLEQKWPE